MSVRPDIVASWVFRLTADGRPEILLVRRSADRLYPGLWQCVTGRLEVDESIVAGALREVAEETGLVASDIEELYETDIVNWFHEASVDAVVCEAVFAARVRSDAAIAISPEHDEARWLDPVAAKALVVWPAYERAIDTVAWLVDHPDRAVTFRLSRPGETNG